VGTDYFIGQIMLGSVLQGGPNPAFLTQTVVEHLLCGLQGVKIHVTDIPDYSTQEII